MGTSLEVTMDCAVLTYNSAGEIESCIAALRSAGAERIVVVDNASTDDTVEKVRALGGIEVITNEVNRGFAAGANQAIRATTGEVCFLVNPDTEVAGTALASLEACVDAHDRAAVVGPLITNPDGSVQPTKRAFPSLWHAFLHATVGLVWPSNPGTRAYVLADADLNAARTVDWVAATAIAVRRSAFEAVGGFDEDFFFFVEDVDLCRRLWDQGLEVWFEPAAQVMHGWGASWTQRPLRFLWLHHVNLFRYVRKHRRGSWRLLYPAIVAGLAVRFLAMVVRWLVTRRSVPVHRREPR